MQHEDEDDRQAGKWKDGDFLTPKEVAEVLRGSQSDERGLCSAPHSERPAPGQQDTWGSVPGSLVGR